MIVSVQGKFTLTATTKQLIHHHLELGGMIAFPTDTLYGLGVKAGNHSGVDYLYGLKNRNESKPLIMMGSDKNQFIPYTSDPSLFHQAIFDALWPGPLTVVMPFRKETGLYFCPKHSATIGFRIPNLPILLDLLSYLSFPLLTTSANLSGEETYSEGRSIQNWLLTRSSEPVIVLNGGRLQNSPSTVISLSSPSSFSLLRSGNLPIEKIASFFPGKK